METCSQVQVVVATVKKYHILLQQNPNSATLTLADEGSSLSTQVCWNSSLCLHGLLQGKRPLKTVPHHPYTQSTHADMLSSEDFLPTDRAAELRKLIHSTHQWLLVIPPRTTPIRDLNILIMCGLDRVIFKVDSNSITIRKCTRTANSPIQKEELRSFQRLNFFKRLNGARQHYSFHAHHMHADSDNVRHYGKEKTARRTEKHGRWGGG